MIKFYNTLSGKKEVFKPQNPQRVTIYVCGLTPYDHAHIGHARTYCAFDMIKRFLISKGYGVYHIQNITDVDDKIINRAKETGRDAKEIPEFYHNEALLLFKKLNIIPADVYPKVTAHIEEIIHLIERLMEKGYAYETETGVYYRVARFADYGKLSKQSIEELKEGARIAPDETKKDARDFALWKKGQDIISFESPWGIGRPGWHIECSAMALKYGGETLDIHGGAKDLIFPHHENEIAQSEGATGKPFVLYWMHTGFLTVNGEKMSKSLGNFITLKDVVGRFSSNAIRLFFALTHYRSPIDYSEEALARMEETAKRMEAFWFSICNEDVEKGEDDIALREEVFNIFAKMDAALEDDFNLPEAMGEFFKLMHITNKAIKEGRIRQGLLESIKRKTKEIMFIIGFELRQEQSKELKALVQYLINLRAEYRKTKQYEKADEIRNHLKDIGIILNDDGEKTRWTWIR
jgi:cysteinyl-tRNA synthetase